MAKTVKGRKILLIEPNYKNKYPPIGLMKISHYHKLLGDDVRFFKGDMNDLFLELRYNKCMAALNRLNNKINWADRLLPIQSYLKTKRLDRLNEAINRLSVHDAAEASTILRKYAYSIPKGNWDRIYITTLFTFYWEITIKTIQAAKKLVDTPDKIRIGGVMATLLKGEIEEATGIKPYSGLLDKPGILDENNIIIDELPLDYSILHEIDYQYPTQSAYFTYTTKGCTRKCAFCSVPKLEPVYKNKIESIDKYKKVIESFGEQRNLLLMDNNVLASPKFPEIIAEIKAMGFTKDAVYEEPNQLALAIRNLKAGLNDRAYVKRAFHLIHELLPKLKDNEVKDNYNEYIKQYNLLTLNKATKSNLIRVYPKISSIYEKYRKKPQLTRYVDFNQGVDARYATEELMKLMSEIPIKPLRIAFDHIGIKNKYINAVEMAAKYGITGFSNYILYNFYDKPEDFYERLKINVELGKQLKVAIFSFPMKYIPLFGEEAKHRRFIGEHWNRKFIRAVQCILNATKGIVAPGYEFFFMAFGQDLDSFMELLYMPEPYIINRNYFEKNGMTQRWREDFNSLEELEKIRAKEIIKTNDFQNIYSLTDNNKILRLLSHYSLHKEDKRVIDGEVKKLRNKFNRLIKKDVFVNLTLTHDFDSKKRSRILLSGN